VARVFSGIQPTGNMHLGNFLGAVARWADQQPPTGSEAARAGETMYCVVDLHAMTAPWDPAELTAKTRELAMLLLAAGIDPARSLLFVQSHVGGLHGECTWILNCVASYGELRRMTQFKDKAAKGGSAAQDAVSAGLLDYPVLMASDILLYDTDEVPVGDDQRQHVELTRDLAERFNGRFGPTFVVPKATVPAAGARIMDLQDPTRKMSKSDDVGSGCVYVLDEPTRITKKIKSAVTDSGTDVRYDPPAKPGVSNLLEIYAATSGTPIAAAEREFAGAGYGTFKQAVADAVVSRLEPVQARYRELAADPAEVERILAAGADRAAAKASAVLERVRTAVGLLPRRPPT
jgi:tryptophanyl-tRNA synthetase